jgi:hypothetical protein
MASFGTLESKEIKTSKAGKPYGIAVIDGNQHLAFGKVTDSLSRVAEGSEVEYTAAPPEKEGDKPRLIFIKGKGGAATVTTTTTTPTTTTKTPTTSGDRDKAIHWQVAYKMATDLVVAGGFVSLAEAVEKVNQTATELYLGMTKHIHGTPVTVTDTTAKVEVTSDPR